MSLTGGDYAGMNGVGTPGEQTGTGSELQDNPFYKAAEQQGPSVAPTPAPTGAGSTPGSTSWDITTPGGFAASANAAGQSAGGFMSGLRQAVFGSDQASPSGDHGGLFGLGNLPGMGLIRDALSVPSGIIDTGLNAVGGVLNAIPDPFAAANIGTNEYEAQLDALPDSPEKEALLKSLPTNPLLTVSRDQQIHDFLQGMQTNPDLMGQKEGSLKSLYPEWAQGAAPSVGGLIGQLLNMPLQRPLERLIAGFGSFGPNRLQQSIEKFQNNDPNISPAEQVAASHVLSGAWTADHALDFLAASHAGISDQGWQELLGSVLTDPTTLATAGAGLVGKGLEAGATFGRAAEGLQAGIDAANEAGDAARVAELTSKLQDLSPSPMARFGQAMSPLAESALGTSAHVALKALDPIGTALGYLGGPTKDLLMSNLAARTTKGWLMGSIGAGNHEGLMNILHDAGGQDLVDAVSHGTGVGVNNMGQELLGRQAGENFAQIMNDTNDELIPGGGRLPSEVVQSMNVPKDMDMQIAEEGERVKQIFAAKDTVEQNLQEANLAKKMTNLFGHDDSYWRQQVIDRLNQNQLAELHMSLYGETDSKLVTAKNAEILANGDHPLITSKNVATAGKKTPTSSATINRVILMDERTLSTDDLGALLKKLRSKTLSNDEKMQVLKTASAKYSQVSKLVNIPANGLADTTLSAARTVLQKLQDSGSLSRRLTKEEFDALPDGIKDLMGPNTGWKAGVSPDEGKRWGFIQDSEGRYTGLNPWIDHSADAIPAYQPSRIAGYVRNVAGDRLGPIAQMAAAPVTGLEMGLRTLMGDTSGRLVALAAQNKFVGRMTERGISTDLAQRMWKDLVVKAEGSAGGTVGGLKGQDMWTAVHDVVEANGLARGVEPMLTARDLMNDVLKSMEGDLRTVGATQKFTGWMRQFFGRFIGKNNELGNLSAAAWQQLHFAFNALYGAWQYTEQWVFNPMRGVMPAVFGPNERDAELIRLYSTMNKTGMFTSARRGEFAVGNAFGSLGENTQGLADDLERLISRNKVNSLNGVSRTRFYNYLRQWGSQFGGAVRKAYGDDFMDLLSKHYQGAADHALSDNELAVRYLSEKLQGNTMTRLAKSGDRLDYGAIMKDAHFSVPNSVGEMPPLDMEYMSRTYFDMTMKEMRSAISSGRISINQVGKELSQVATISPDALQRIMNSLQFNLPDFYQELKTGYNLSAAQFTDIRNLLEGQAKARGMTPTDYLSQLFAPRVSREGAMGKDAIRALKDGYTQLSVAGKGSYNDFMQTLSRVLSHNIDDSGKEVLMRAIDGLPHGAPVDVAKWSTRHDRGVAELLSGYARGAKDAKVAQKGANPALGAVAINNPNVVRILQGYGKVTGNISKTILGLPGLSDEAKAALNDVLGIPTDKAIFGDFGQVKAWNAMMEVIREGENDAFRLMYYARQQGLLLRSINHPFFGIYPASFMFGKMAPEIMRFIAKSPFGIHTSALAYALNDVRQTLGVQMESDPKMAKFVEGLGGDPIIALLSFLLPANPFDMPAAAPGWMRALSAAGIKQRNEILAGKNPSAINYKSMFDSLATYMNPLQRVTNEVAPVLQEGVDVFGQPGGKKGSKRSKEVLPGAFQELGGPGVGALDELKNMVLGQGKQPAQPAPQFSTGTGEVGNLSGPYNSTLLTQDLEVQGANILAAIEGLKP